MLETATDERSSTPAATTRPRDPAWVRPALLVILAVAALLYLWDLGASGWSNDFYAAAVQAGTKSWTSFFFASSDWGNVITVDKPPAAMWVMALSGRIFGFSSWSMLVPEALMGVASVWLLYAAVRRWSGPAAGLAAAASFAVTPVVVLMFRFNNPDALLVLLMLAAAYCVTRAVDAAASRGGTWWLALAGVALGFAFLTKTLQSFLVLPALALVYLVCAPTGLWRRMGQLLVGGAALVVAAGWYVVATMLWPAESRPYLGGSGDNTFLGLAFGYNGLDRVVSGGGGGPGGGPGGGGFGGGGFGGGGFGGTTGLTRLLNEQMGTQIAWFLPAAVVALVAGLWLTRRAARTDRVRAGLILWGGWLVVTAGIFSYMEGIFHSYYNVALAPGVAATLAIGGRELWRVRGSVAGRVGLAGLVAVSAWVAWELLGRAADWNPWLRWVVLVAGVLGALALLVGARPARRVAVVGAAVGAVAVLAGPAAYAAQTAATPHTGSTPTAGPAGTGGFGGPGTRRGQFPGGDFPGAPNLPGGNVPNGNVPNGNVPNGNVPNGNVPNGNVPNGNGPGGTAQGGNPPGGTAPGGTAPGGTAPGGTAPGGTAPGGTAPGGSAPGTPGANGGPGFGRGGQADAAVVALLKKTTTKWAAAAIGSQSASALQLESDRAVIPIGGFSGGDPAPTLARFQQWVAEGRIHYFVGGGMGGGGRGGGRGGDRGTAGAISTWVEQHYTATTVGSQTVYDLTKPTS
ncbi:glycosyltransferase family 39 protein [Cryptosporangium arvum]|uniref:glycosyltransferase family 39 protein n=1 Tax=Cryptosporangium arvum TaxID=80871 RepID=UPI001B806CB3|nr:glycosyltransferase family 39 protein [Cryptosporangium arvum]